MIEVQAVDLGIRVTNMTKPINRLFCRLDGLSPAAKEQKRLSILSKLGLLAAETVPVFDEATQTASSYLDAPICILGLAVENELWFKSAVGLSKIGLMNQLASDRKIQLYESFSTYIIDSEQALAIENTTVNPVFTNTSLVQHYGIKSYLGVPLISPEGFCIGTLEVMDLQAREFSNRDLDFLALTARWCLREFERDYLIKTQTSKTTENLGHLPVLNPTQPAWQAPTPAKLEIVKGTPPSHGGACFDFVNPSLDNLSSTNLIKVKLLAQLTQELRTPLTSVIGMASVLRREVYGPLTTKQREYLEIIHNSGQNLITLVDEIVNLGVLNEQDVNLQIASIDIEMLCQQVVNSLVDLAKQQQQTLRLSVEPGHRIWSLDKEKVRQALYYLIISVLEMSEAGGEVRIHVSHRHRGLNIAVWLTHPWLGDGLPQIELYSQSVTKALALNTSSGGHTFEHSMGDVLLGNQILTCAALMTVLNEGENNNHKHTNKISRDLLGLLLSCHLVELHHGQIAVQGSSESGYRYILQLPTIESEEEY